MLERSVKEYILYIQAAFKHRCSASDTLNKAEETCLILINLVVIVNSQTFIYSFINLTWKRWVAAFS